MQNYHSKDTINKAINDPHFIDLDEIVSEVYEVKSLKHSIRHDLPIQIGLNVYLNSKLHTLKFFYCFLKKYIPERCFELLESDTDSMYFAISRRSLDDCVPEHLKAEYFRARLRWLPAELLQNTLNLRFNKEQLIKFGKRMNAVKNIIDLPKEH